MPRIRLLVFIQQDSPYAMQLLNALSGAITSRKEISLAGIVSCGGAPSTSTSLRNIAQLRLQRVLDPTLPAMPRFPRFRTPQQIAGLHGAHYMPLKDKHLENPAFLQAIKQFHASHLINLYTTSRFPQTLIQRMECALNYHNGLLPHYRGLKATHWSLYHRESETGFVWHLMERDFDTGNIILTDAVPITRAKGVAWLEWEKTCLAVEMLPQLLQLLLEGSPGSTQPAGGSYFSKSDYQKITNISDASTVSADELRWRQQCFTRIFPGHQGRSIPVTRFAKSFDQKAKFSFLCKDGEFLSADRCNFLPPAIYAWQRKELRQ